MIAERLFRCSGTIALLSCWVLDADVCVVGPPFWSRQMTSLRETAIVGENVEVIQTQGARAAFTWSVVIAGALAAWAVAFIFISLGAGIGLAISTPYSGPSPTAMTIGGAIWLIMSQTIAFTVAGY